MYLDNFIPFSMNKPLLLRGLVAAMSGSRETIIEETDITNSTEGATSYGKNNYECAGIICTDAMDFCRDRFTKLDGKAV